MPTDSVILVLELWQPTNAGISPKLAAIDRILLTRLGEFDLDAKLNLGENLIKAGIT